MEPNLYFEFLSISFLNSSFEINMTSLGAYVEAINGILNISFATKFERNQDMILMEEEFSYTH